MNGKNPHLRGVRRDLRRENMGSRPDEPPGEAMGLRTVVLPYADAPRTWQMEADAATLRPDRPLHDGAVGVFQVMPPAHRGFWNDLPKEEEREPVLQMEPFYPSTQNHAVMYHGINVNEVFKFVVMTYFAMAVARLSVSFMLYIS